MNILKNIKKTVENYSDELYQVDSINWINYHKQMGHNVKDIFLNGVSYKINDIKGGCNKRKDCNPTIDFKTQKYNIICDNPYVNHNDCGLITIKIILKIDFKISDVRKQFNLKYEEKILMDKLIEIYNFFKKENDKSIKIIDEKYNGYIDLNLKNYVMYSNNHYRQVINIEYNNQKNKKTKRGELY